MYNWQIHFGKKPSPKLFLRIENYNDSVNKPSGGLWTSTYTQTEKYLCDWQDWCLGNEHTLYGDPWLLVVKPGARLVTPRTADKFIISTEYGGQYDWVAMSKEYDGFHFNEVFSPLKENYLWRIHYDFDAESTIWFNWQFEDVMPFSEEAVEKFMIRLKN